MKYIIAYFKSSKWTYILWPYLLILFLHILFVSQAEQPWIKADEFIQLGHAKYFAGEGYFTFLKGFPYAHFAYAFFIAPVFWFFTEPASIYQAIVTVNAILASALYFPIYYILRNLFSLDKKTSSIISLVTCFYPTFTTQSIIAWQEAIIFTFHATTIALLLYFLKKKTYLSALLFASSLGFLYMMHIRVFPMLMLTVIFLLFLSIYRRELRGKLIFSVIVVLAFFVATKLANEHMVTIAWQDEVMTYSISNMLSRITSLAGIKIFLSRVLGQVLYLIQATYGLFFLGVLYLLQNIWQNKKESLKETLKNDSVVVLSYLLVTSLGVFFVSTLFNSVPDLINPSQLLYGRYNELFIALFISLGLLSFYFKTNKKWHYLLIIILVFGSSIYLQKEILAISEKASPHRIASITLWLALFQKLDLLAISTVIFSFFLIMIRLFTKKFIYGIFIISILFGMNISAYYAVMSTLNATFLSTNDLLTTLKRLEVDKAYYVDGSFCEQKDPKLSEWLIGYNKYNFQWQYSSMDLEIFDLQSKENPKYEYIIASTCWSLAEEMQVKMIQEDRYGVQAIWRRVE